MRQGRGCDPGTSQGSRRPQGWRPQLSAQVLTGKQAENPRSELPSRKHRRRRAETTKAERREKESRYTTEKVNKAESALRKAFKQVITPQQHSWRSRKRKRALCTSAVTAEPTSAGQTGSGHYQQLEARKRDDCRADSLTNERV